MFLANHTDSVERESGASGKCIRNSRMRDHKWEIEGDPRRNLRGVNTNQSSVKGTHGGQQVRTNGMIKKSICRPAFLGYCSRRGKNTIAKLASRIGLVILWRSLNLKSPLRPTESALKNAPVSSVPKTVV